MALELIGGWEGGGNVILLIYPYLCNMDKQQVKQLDLSQWITQAEYARLTGYKLGTVSQWVKRAKAGEGGIKIEYLEVPELSLTLVRRP